MICTYKMDRRPVLIESLESVRAQSHAPAEIILAVDHEDELFAIARDRFVDVEVVPSAEGPGIQGDRNTGCAGATGAESAFLDDDSKAEQDWLERLLE